MTRWTADDRIDKLRAGAVGLLACIVVACSAAPTPASSAGASPGDRVVASEASESTDPIIRPAPPDATTPPDDEPSPVPPTTRPTPGPMPPGLEAALEAARWYADGGDDGWIVGDYAGHTARVDLSGMASFNERGSYMTAADPIDDVWHFYDVGPDGRTTELLTLPGHPGEYRCDPYCRWQAPLLPGH